MLGGRGLAGASFLSSLVLKKTRVERVAGSEQHWDALNERKKGVKSEGRGVCVCV